MSELIKHEPFDNVDVYTKLLRMYEHRMLFQPPHQIADEASEREMVRHAGMSGSSLEARHRDMVGLGGGSNPIHILCGADLTDSQHNYIVHQANCTGRRPAGLAEDMFARFPSSNTYTSNDREPGTISTHNVTTSGGGQAIVVNLYGQHNPGRPTRHETRGQRLEWFRAGLVQLGHDIRSSGASGVTVAMPYLIGCDAAGGSWSDYYRTIVTWATELGVEVYLHDKYHRSQHHSIQLRDGGGVHTIESDPKPDSLNDGKTPVLFWKVTEDMHTNYISQNF